MCSNSVSSSWSQSSNASGTFLSGESFSAVMCVNDFLFNKTAYTRQIINNKIRDHPHMWMISDKMWQ